MPRGQLAPLRPPNAQAPTQRDAPCGYRPSSSAGARTAEFVVQTSSYPRTLLHLPAPPRHAISPALNCPSAALVLPLQSSFSNLPSPVLLLQSCFFSLASSVFLLQSSFFSLPSSVLFSVSSVLLSL